MISLKSSKATTDVSLGEFEINHPWQTHLCDPPATRFSVTKNECLDYFTKMTQIRRLEMTADALYKSKLIRGFCHLALGQEAIPVGMKAAITPQDSIITAYRCHGFTLIRGTSAHAIFAELMGMKHVYINER
jgi:pyruvate dehydrogenase E1 component alpha subunit